MAHPQYNTVLDREIPTRLLHFSGIGRIETAYGTDHNEGKTMAIQNGGVAYFARVELTDKTHPELTDNHLEVQVREAPREKHLGHLFVEVDELVENARNQSECYPLARADENLIPKNYDVLDKVVDNVKYNIVIRIFSEFLGYWDTFGPRFNEEITYEPVVQAIANTLKEFLETEKGMNGEGKGK